MKVNQLGISCIRYGKIIRGLRTDFVLLASQTQTVDGQTRIVVVGKPPVGNSYAFEHCKYQPRLISRFGLLIPLGAIITCTVQYYYCVWNNTAPRTGELSFICFDARYGYSNLLEGNGRPPERTSETVRACTPLVAWLGVVSGQRRRTRVTRMTRMNLDDD